MYVQGPASPVVIVSDWRHRHDVELDISRPNDGPHVFARWKMGPAALGYARYSRVRRVALFDYEQRPSASAISLARQRWLRLLDESPGPLRVIVLPTPDVSSGELRSAIAGTVCWSALKPPDGLDAMRLTAWKYGRHVVTPVFSAARRTKPLQMWAMAQAMQRAAGSYPLEPKEGNLLTCIRSGVVRSALLHFARSNMPLAVDLEFLPKRNIVTAVGISDGHTSVSIPWHDYVPTGCVDTEHGVSCRPDIAALTRDALASSGPKYFHNYVADVPRLQRLGMPVGGTLCDTFAAHAIAFPELRHGLQAAAASLLYVPPWKSLYRPRDAHGFCRDDEEYWTASPECHRDYNAKDAFYCWHLAQKVLPCVGIDPQTGAEDEAA